MIAKVRTIWITDFLEQSLFQQTRVLLGLSERIDIVARPFDLLVKRPEQGERPLPSGTKVVDVYNTVNQELLILGAPGSGKTTLLLELARDLLDRAKQDQTHPIPVIFPLSTWSETCKPLNEWLVDELTLRYNVPRKIAQEWVAFDEVLPLLDGLDEVKAGHRVACVEAVNDFRQSHGLLPLVITSRTADYQALAKPLRLHGAILVRPLTHEQVIEYLAELGSAGDLVRAALREDPSLWDLLDSPLLLNIVTVSYAGQTAVPAPITGTAVERRDQLFGSYVKHMLVRRAADSRYTREQTVRWLSWLAHQMDDHGQTVFDLERLQLDWLSRGQRQTIRKCAGRIAGTVFGIVGFGLFAGVYVGLAFAIFIGPLVGLVAGSLTVPAVGLFFGCVLHEIDTRDGSNEGMRLSTRFSLFGLVGGLGLGLAFGLVLTLYEGLVGGLLLGLAFGLYFALIGGLLAFGEDCLKHVILRVWLVRNGSTPWNYARFLDFAAERILLRKVGGGYVFLHRILLEHFAAGYVEPSAGSTPRVKPSTIRFESYST